MTAHDCGGTWAESGFVRLLDLNAGLMPPRRPLQVSSTGGTSSDPYLRRG